MRVLYVSHSAGLSGAEQALLRLIGALDREAVEPVVLVPQDGPLIGRLQALGVETRVEPTRWWIPATHWTAETFVEQLEGLEGRCEAVTRAVDATRPDLVHSNVVVSLEGAVAAARAGLPHVWHSRGLFGNGFPPSFFDDIAFFLGIVDRLADVVVCVSKAVEREAARYGSVAERVVVPDGFDVEPLLAQRVETREALARRLGLDPSVRLVLALGGIQRRKGQKDLVEAAALLAREFPDVVVALAGHPSDPEYVAELDDLVRARGLERVVRSIGFHDEVHSLLVHSEVLVHPSLSEGFALSVLEAMAVGTPVVATRSGGPEEILEHERSGLLVEAGAPEALAEAIRRLLSDRTLAARLRREGPERAARFSLAASASGVADVYRKLLAQEREIPSDRREIANRACGDVLMSARLAAGRARP